MEKLGYYNTKTGNIAIPASSTVNPNFYTECTINRCVTPCNSAPIITKDPFIVARVNTLQSFHTGIID